MKTKLIAVLLILAVSGGLWSAGIGCKEKENVYAEQQEESGDKGIIQEEVIFAGSKDELEPAQETTENVTEQEENSTQNEVPDYVSDAAEISKKLSTYNFYNEDEKTVYLTFDDGATTTITPQILDVLEQEDVKATFFMIGDTIEKGGEKVKDIIRRVYEQGHSIGNHTYSHNYKYLYPDRNVNVTNFVADMEKTDKLLKSILGDDFSTRLVRCPGGTMSWKNMSELMSSFEENNRVSVDWNALSKDAEGGKKTASELIQNVKETSEGKDMVVLLMHDTYGKEETVKALPSIIRYFKEQGYQFKTLA